MLRNKGRTTINVPASDGNSSNLLAEILMSRSSTRSSCGTAKDCNAGIVGANQGSVLQCTVRAIFLPVAVVLGTAVTARSEIVIVFVIIVTRVQSKTSLVAAIPVMAPRTVAAVMQTLIDLPGGSVPLRNTPLSHVLEPW